MTTNKIKRNTLLPNIRVSIFSSDSVPVFSTTLIDFIDANTAPGVDPITAGELSALINGKPVPFGTGVYVQAFTPEDL